MSKVYSVLLLLALAALATLGSPLLATCGSSPLTADEMRSVLGGADPVQPCYTRDQFNCPSGYGSDCQTVACTPVYGPGTPPPILGFVCPQTDWRFRTRVYYYGCHPYGAGEQGDGNDNCALNNDHDCGLTTACTACSPDPDRGWWYCGNAETSTVNKQPSAVLSGPQCSVRHGEDS